MRVIAINLFRFFVCSHKVLFCALCIMNFVCIEQIAAQIKPVQLPEMGRHSQKQPVYQPNGYYYSNKSNGSENMQQMQYPIGATAQDIISMQNSSAMQRMGYKPPPTQAEIQRDALQKAFEYNKSVKEKREEELEEILNEARKEEMRVNYKRYYFQSPEFIAETKPFTDAFNNVKSMLNGKTKLSVRTAFYSVEAAYGKSYLTRSEYDKIITESAAFVKTWLIQNKYDISKNENLHLGIQRFMKDTLTINIPSSLDSKIPLRQKTHLPFRYDYDDYKGEQDHRNYFMTKTLATGYGQCDGLPDVYIAIAEALGATVYMTFAPFHEFVKYPINGTIHNYEPTSHWSISDKWYKDNMFINTRAVETGIYLDTLNRKMIVANSLLDMAFAYMTKYGTGDGKFIDDCINTAMEFFPRKNNITAYMLKSSILARKLNRLLQAYGIRNLNEIDKVPGAKALYDELRKNEEIISSLGYQEMPENLYEELMKQQEFKGQVQHENNINGKQKRSLFIQQ